MSSAQCDLCGTYIQTGEGYAFYSSAKVFGMTTGNMMLCSPCGDGVVVYLQGQSIPAFLVEGDDIEKSVRTANIEGIAAASRQKGLSPAATCDKARARAKAFWDEKRREEEVEHQRRQQEEARAKRDAEERKRRDEEEQRRKKEQEQTIQARRSSGLCLMCGGKLSFLARMFGNSSHGGCKEFRPH